MRCSRKGGVSVFDIFFVNSIEYTYIQSSPRHSTTTLRKVPRRLDEQPNRRPRRHHPRQRPHRRSRPVGAQRHVRKVERQPAGDVRQGEGVEARGLDARGVGGGHGGGVEAERLPGVVGGGLCAEDLLLGLGVVSMFPFFGWVGLV